MNRLIVFLKSNTFTLLLALALFGWVAWERAPNWIQQWQLRGKPVPVIAALSVPPDGGRSASVDPVRRGQKTLLVFWATWCGFCRSDIPDLNQLHSELEGRGLHIAAISEEHPLALRNFRDQTPMNYDIYSDRDGQLHRAYSIQAYPTLVYLDAEGRIESMSTGMNLALKARVRRWATGSLLAALGLAL
ncbi:MAG: TlpA family protein disulfide reductase [Leptospirales bacterium]|nr:TlpA family protein disulfide reductase [Leptospirales bacterium]